MGTLRSLSPPNVGVTGPSCNEGNRVSATRAARRIERAKSESRDPRAHNQLRIGYETPATRRPRRTAPRARARPWPAAPVTGFSCSRLQKILTHNFTHRTHMLIFEHYYPPVFSDWWMDDWITHVYGPARTRRGPFLVRHRIGHQGTRYEVDQSHEQQLQACLLYTSPSPRDS